MLAAMMEESSPPETPIRIEGYREDHGETTFWIVRRRISDDPEISDAVSGCAWSHGDHIASILIDESQMQQAVPGSNSDSPLRGVTDFGSPRAYICAARSSHDTAGVQYPVSAMISGSDPMTQDPGVLV
ncbi:hypothetical protein RLDS_06680 [Sphingobium lactosutens DS20]|uniref:Uncharacterized protein n=1 Tax=Sphingobium lactosutens DS20 TaxID=1331060 RepID=T0HUL3_9SPHN|nr:hypothetical protein RLDS_06680 [Sphingobium lactosutens DS20]